MGISENDIDFCYELRMIDQNENFAEYFILAQEEALTPRQSRIVDLRFGFANGEHHTLQQICQEFGLSRERIRQIIQQSLRKIRSKGKRHITRRQTDNPCAKLLLYLESILIPEEPGNLDRIFTYAKDELSYLPLQTMALPLVVYLLYGQRETTKQYFDELFRKCQDEIISLRRAAKFDFEFNDLLTYIIWSSEVTKNFNRSDFSHQREVSPNGEGISGSFFSDKMFRNIQYESHLELQFLCKLEQAKDVVFYQEQPLVIPYQLDGIARKYYPDLFFALEDGRGIVAEIKPYYQMALYNNLIKWSAFYKFCALKGWGMLVTDGKRPFQKLQYHELPKGFESTLLTNLTNSEAGFLSWKEYRQIRDLHNATWLDFVSVIIKNRLAWSLQPFVLKRRGS